MTDEVPTARLFTVRLAPALAQEMIKPPDRLARNERNRTRTPARKRTGAPEQQARPVAEDAHGTAGDDSGVAGETQRSTGSGSRNSQGARGASSSAAAGCSRKHRLWNNVSQKSKVRR